MKSVSQSPASSESSEPASPVPEPSEVKSKKTAKVTKVDKPTKTTKADKATKTKPAIKKPTKTAASARASNPNRDDSVMMPHARMESLKRKAHITRACRNASFIIYRTFTLPKVRLMTAEGILICQRNQYKTVSRSHLLQAMASIRSRAAHAVTQH